MKELMTGTYVNKTTDGNFNFNFYTDLTTVQKLKFVQSVTSLLVDGENYNSIIRDLIFDFFIVEIFTDINTEEISKTNFVYNAEKFLEETNVVDIVRANVDDGLFEELNKAIDLDIRYKTGIHPSPLNDALASLLSTLEKKISEIDLGSAMEMAQKFAGMKGELTPESVVNAYMNSDLHQKNVEEIAESKKEKIQIAENLDKAIKIVQEESKTKAKSKSKKSED